MNFNDSVFSLHDLGEIEPEVAGSFANLLKMKDDGRDVEDIGLMFELSVDFFGSQQVIELIRDGSNIPVTNDNVEKYVELFIDWKLNKSINNRFVPFKEGYDMICSTPIMKIFAPEELSELVSGVENYDWKEFRKKTKIEGFKKADKTVEFFWSIFENDWDDQTRINFLNFVTGSRTAPIGGLGKLGVKIAKVDDKNLLPVAHTCFNKLDLPNYNDREVMKRNLSICLENCEGFGLK